jgi:hypothetical protein
MEPERIPAEAFLEMYPERIRAIADELRGIVLRALPEAIEGVRLGWRIIGFDVPHGRPSTARSDRRSAGRPGARSGRGSTYFCFVMPEAKHVHLGFHYGVFMDDPGRVLHGNVRQARWVMFVPGDLIDEPMLAGLVLEGARVALLSRPERLARLLDRDAEPIEAPVR